jgi:hypothetical protein
MTEAGIARLVEQRTENLKFFSPDIPLRLLPLLLFQIPLNGVADGPNNSRETELAI